MSDQYYVLHTNRKRGYQRELYGRIPYISSENNAVLSITAIPRDRLRRGGGVPLRYQFPPVSKILLDSIPPALLAALLYLGAGVGMFCISLPQTARNRTVREAPLRKNDLPHVIGMIGLDIAAPVLLMFGLTMTTAANASLLNNFEIVTTVVIAFLIFREAVDRRLWVAILLIVAASIILTVEDLNSFAFSAGSILVLLAYFAWSFENNCTRMLSLKNPIEIVVIKGFGAGCGALILALLAREMTTDISAVGAALLLGFFAYGLSIYLYVLAQRSLGAARTSTFYAIALFIGVGLSFVIFKTPLTISFTIASLIMILGAYLAATGGHRHRHIHLPLSHNHRHHHDDDHHAHLHDAPGEEDHAHVHTHAPPEHSHPHTPDLHHTHGHRHRARQNPSS